MVCFQPALLIAGANLVFMLNKHILLSLIYQYFRKESQQYYFIEKENPRTHEINTVMQTNNNSYNTNSLIGGITWKF